MTVEPLDPLRVVGERSRVRAVYRVQFDREPAPHRVFDDRHGWYCDEHGPRCRAVDAARAWAGGLPPEGGAAEAAKEGR